MSYDLTSGLSDSFEFKANVLGKENHYTVKYPSQKELEPLSRGYARLAVLDKEFAKLEESSPRRKEIESEVEEISKTITEAFTKLFTPSEGSISVTEMLENLPLNAKRNFDQMIQKEFGVNDEK